MVSRSYTEAKVVLGLVSLESTVHGVRCLPSLTSDNAQADSACDAFLIQMEHFPCDYFSSYRPYI